MLAEREPHAGAGDAVAHPPSCHSGSKSGRLLRRTSPQRCFLFSYGSSISFGSCQRQELPSGVLTWRDGTRRREAGASAVSTCISPASRHPVSMRSVRTAPVCPDGLRGRVQRQLRRSGVGRQQARRQRWCRLAQSRRGGGGGDFLRPRGGARSARRRRVSGWARGRSGGPPARRESRDVGRATPGEGVLEWSARFRLGRPSTLNRPARCPTRSGRAGRRCWARRPRCSWPSTRSSRRRTRTRRARRRAWTGPPPRRTGPSRWAAR